MELKEYLLANFPGLVLKPSLFYQWNKSIHFELAKDLYQIKSETDELNPIYFKTVYEQAISLFNALFSADDKIILVTNIYQYKDYIRRSKRKIKVYSHYIKNKDVRFQLKQEMLTCIFDDEDEIEKKCITQFSLACRKQDIRYPSLIKAICNQDFPSLKPRLHNPYGLYEPDVFFINVTNNVIFYIYDDRGCEVIASDRESIRPLYEKYSDWIDELTREEISCNFK